MTKLNLPEFGPLVSLVFPRWTEVVEENNLRLDMLVTPDSHLSTRSHISQDHHHQTYFYYKLFATFCHFIRTHAGRERDEERINFF